MLNNRMEKFPRMNLELGNLDFLKVILAFSFRTGMEESHRLLIS